MKKHTWLAVPLVLLVVFVGWVTISMGLWTPWKPQPTLERLDYKPQPRVEWTRIPLDNGKAIRLPTNTVTVKIEGNKLSCRADLPAARKCLLARRAELAKKRGGK